MQNVPMTQKLGLKLFLKLYFYKLRLSPIQLMESGQRVSHPLSLPGDFHL